MFEHRIAVTGLTGAGRMSFITSLLDHWMKHDREQNRFKLGKSNDVDFHCD